MAQANRVLNRPVIIAMVLSLFAGGARAAVTFSKIVDTTDNVPGKAQLFEELVLFDTPAIDGGNVVFRGLSTNPNSTEHDGIYTNRTGSLTAVAEVGDPIPDGGGDLFATGATFGFASPSISGNNIVFQGHSPGDAETGVYASFAGGALETIADTRGPSTGSFTTMSSPAISGGNIAYWTFFVNTFPVSTSFEQIQKHTGGSGGSSAAVATEGDTVLGKSPVRTMTFFNTAQVEQDGDDTLFLAMDTTGAIGLYRTFGSTTVGAPRTYDGDPIPDGGGATFDLSATSSLSADGGVAAFLGEDAGATVQGIYLLDGFDESTIADLNTIAPGGGGAFSAFEAVSIEGATEDVAFAARDAGGNLGLYARHNGSFGLLIEVGDTLDGKTVDGIQFGHEGLDGVTAVFSVAFADGSEGIYTTDISQIPTCNPGDTDSDGDIDTADLTTSVINFTGAGGSGKTCADGDTDADGDVDTADLTFSIINFTGASAANPNVPDLVYDPATGNVRIDADGADVISFSLQSGPFNAADFSELPAGLTDNIASQIGWTSFNLFSGLTGVADLGAILPAGLDLAGLEASLTTASYGLALAGGGGGRLDIVIPEPASMMLMGLLAVAFARGPRAKCNLPGRNTRTTTR